MTVTHIVLRPFTVGGKDLQSGDPVDASSWRNTERLVTTKYLRAAHGADRKASAQRRAAPVVRKKFVVKKTTRK